MSDLSPSRVRTEIDEAKAPLGRSFIKLASLIRFANESQREAFAAYLLGAEIPDGVEGVAVWVTAPAANDSAGEPGMIAQDGVYLYLYTGDGETHVWGRIPIAFEWA